MVGDALALRALLTMRESGGPAPLLRFPDVHPPPHRLAVVVGLQPGRVYAVRGEFLVAVLGVAGDADRADHLAVRVADQQAAALADDLLVARADHVVHEDRL